MSHNYHSKITPYMTTKAENIFDRVDLTVKIAINKLNTVSELYSELIGILILRFNIGIICINLCVYPFTIEYDEPKKFGLSSSLNLLDSFIPI